MQHQGILAVISGFSGAGKGTVMKALLEQYDSYALSVSATTREPRPGEANGREYFFVSEQEFTSMIEKGDLIEYARYVNHYYGTPKAYVESMLAEGKDVLLEIEIQGALKVKQQFPEALLVFIVPPSAVELKNRLLSRGTESEDVIEKRLSRAAEEAEGMSSYDYILVNDTVEDCTARLHGLIQSQHYKTSANQKLIVQMEQELKELTSKPKEI